MARLKSTMLLLGALILMLFGVGSFESSRTHRTLSAPFPEKVEASEIREARAIVAKETITVLNELSKTATDRYELDHLLKPPSIFVEEKLGGEARVEVLNHLDIRIAGQQIIGSSNDIDATRNYLLIKAEFRCDLDPKDGSPVLEFVIEKESKKLVFVYFVPQG